VKIVYLPFALLILLSASAQAELKWDQTIIELKPALGDKQAIAHFKYQNTGKTPIKVKSTRASCGCTAAQSQKSDIAPGDKGEVTATFSIGDRTGLQVKTVTVETDDPTHPSTVLTLKADIPQVVELQPNFVYWQAGEEAKPKTVVARVGKNIPIKKLYVTSMNPQFDAKVEPGSAGGEFKIDIQPKATDRPVFSTITVKTDYPKEAPKILYVNARVMGTVPTTTTVQVARTPATAKTAGTPSAAPSPATTP